MPEGTPVENAAPHPSSLDNLNNPPAQEAPPPKQEETPPPPKQEEAPPAPEWKEYEPDPNKSEADNAAAKAEHDKTKPAAAAAPAPVDVTKLTLPEGVTLDENATKAFTELATKHNLTQEVAQDLMNLHTAQLQALAAAPMKAWTDLNQSWVDEVKADPVVGGDKLVGVQADIATILDKYGDPKVREALDMTGAGNHPAMVRTFAKIAAALKEATPVLAEKPAEHAQPLTRAEKIYGKQSEAGA